MGNHHNFESLIERIKASIDILEEVESMTTVKRKGKYYVCKSLFSEEKTPSMFIDVDRQSFKCFSSGISGDVIDLYQHRMRITQLETIHYLRDRLGIVLSGEPEAVQRMTLKASLIVTTKACATFFFRNRHFFTFEGNKMSAYLASKGISDHVARSMGVGMTGSNCYEKLEQYLIHNTGGKFLGMQQSGLNTFVKILKSRHPCIVFPIINQKKQVEGFSVRSNSDLMRNNVPKYTNSKASNIFNKSNVLYGINIAKENILTKSFVVICEGYTDVLAMHSIGMDNTVGVMSANMSDYQIDIIKSLCCMAIICMDNDSAGIIATRKISDKLTRNSIYVEVLPINKKDPSDQVVEFGKSKTWHGKSEYQDVHRAVDSCKISVVDFVLGDDFEEISDMQKIERVSRCIKFIRGCSSKLHRVVLASSLTKKTNINAKEVMEEFSPEDTYDFLRKNILENISKHK